MRMDSSIRDTQGASEYVRQLEQDEKIAKLKSINEVEALRGVFYKLFDTSKSNETENTASDNVLISMNLPEVELNPFFDHETDENGYVNPNDS